MPAPKWLRTCRPNGVDDDDDDVCGAADVAADDTYVRRYVMVPIVAMLVPVGLMMLIVMMIRTYVRCPGDPDDDYDADIDGGGCTYWWL